MSWMQAPGRYPELTVAAGCTALVFAATTVLFAVWGEMQHQALLASHQNNAALEQLLSRHWAATLRGKEPPAVVTRSLSLPVTASTWAEPDVGTGQDPGGLLLDQMARMLEQFSGHMSAGGRRVAARVLSEEFHNALRRAGPREHNPDDIDGNIAHSIELHREVMAASRPRLAALLKPGDLAAYDRFVDNMLSHLVASRHIYRMAKRGNQ